MLGLFAPKFDAPRLQTSRWRKPHTQDELAPKQESIATKSPSSTFVPQPLNSSAKVRLEPELEIGGGGVSWFSGPAYVESVDQMIAAASTLSECGARFVRSRAFWPEATKNDFQRHLQSGLKVLSSTAKHFNLKVVSEISSLEDLKLLDKYVDIIEVPPHLANDFRLLDELGYVAKPIILNRHPMMSVERFLSLLECLQRGKMADCILADNGMQSSDPYVASLLDLSSLIQLRRQAECPVLVNCSVLASSPESVEDIAVAAVAAGADGVLADITIGAAPRNNQALLPQQLSGVIQRTRALKCTINALRRHKYSASDY